MIPTPYTVGHRVHSESGLDAHNNAVDAWAAPVPLQVHAVAPGASVEAVRAGRDVSAVLWTVYAPAGTVVGSRDRIMWQGVEYAVQGQPADWTHGPWVNPAAGVTIELAAWEG